MSVPPLIVIFGAAVGPDGRASAALLRRIGYGLDAAAEQPDAPILCSGGVCRPGPSEASIMADVLLAQGVARERLILDELSRSTIENARAAVAEVARGGHPHVIACSDAYHLPRIRILLRMAGVESRPGPVGSGAPGPSAAHRLGMSLREGLAIPHNLALIITGRERIGP